MQIKESLNVVIFTMLIFGDFMWQNGNACPTVNPRKKIYDASVIAGGARISIEKGNKDYPIILGFYKPADEGCRRSEFARYSVEGSIPNVDSLFFMKAGDKVDVVTIVSWNPNHRGDGTFGKSFKIYAYYLGSDDNLLEDKRISENEAMSGMDGYASGQPSTFRYKTAQEVRQFWRDYKWK
jgi:hypothetical protein